MHLLKERVGGRQRVAMPLLCVEAYTYRCCVLGYALTPGGSNDSFRFNIEKIDTSIFRAVATIAI